ncbi:TfuA-like protein [Micromonospora sp. WMMD1120]|uniref:TfuA-like protein n=1 Tax=Micromonospora sp. WMMD1120 TaxID=3016106 RepID=UPI0024171594|nr:TfuA-like protein [Micromonospora sp. WMMD1120]MDG4809418.1 TfuA-like protein [Micromonospora sp. WMMD1120]
MTDVVFIGPSLPVEEVGRLLPDAVVLPPVAHGDLLRLDVGPGDRVLVIDGFFLQHPPVRHREILDLLDRGVTVAGAASMGALRAAELWQFGMRGVGEVFQLYRDGVVTGDDEVAVVHGPAEEGHRTLSEPLVNIRVALRRAVAAGVLADTEAVLLLDIARDLPFRRRSYRALERTAPPAATAVVDRFLAWHRRNPTDAKGADARLLLSMAADNAPELCPTHGGDQPIDNLHTRFLDSWRARFAGQSAGAHWVSDREAAGVLMLLHPDEPAWHRREVLAGVAGVDSADPTVEERAHQAARERGLGAAPPGGWDWLTDRERTLDDREALLRMVVRAFGTTPHRSLALWMVAAPLRTPELLAAARQVAATAAALNEALPRTTGHRRPGGRLHFRTEVVDACFAALWSCDTGELEAAAWDRGFVDLTAFRYAAEPLVAYLKTFGAPRLPQVATPPLDIIPAGPPARVG